MNETVNLLITGDYCPLNRIEQFSNSGDFKAIFNDFSEYIDKSDFAITNFECPVTSRNTSIPKSGPALKAPALALKTLKNAGFNVVTLANNHIMDFGKNGLEDTIRSCEENELEFTGVKFHSTDSAIKYFHKNDIRFAIVNFAENEFGTFGIESYGAFPLDPVANFRAIKEANQNSDYVIVIVHGGHEMYNLPSPRMVELYRFFVEAGADMVVGHHTHCYSGYEIYKKKPIFYSLGNFSFDNLTNRTDLWCEGFAINLILKKDKASFEIIPFIQNQETVGVQLMNGQRMSLFNENIEYLNKIIANDEALRNRFSDFCIQSKRMYLSFLEPHSNKYFLALQNRHFLPSVWSAKKRKLLLNLIRCESHRDVLLCLLGKK